jgi:hypothetical protein
VACVQRQDGDGGDVEEWQQPAAAPPEEGEAVASIRHPALAGGVGQIKHEAAENEEQVDAGPAVGDERR